MAVLSTKSVAHGGASVTALLVLGMHRSGTSALAGTLIKLGGCAPATLMLAHPKDNERGYWESQTVANLNDEILASAGTSWDDWHAFDSGWYRGAAAAGFRARAADLLVREFANAALPVVKDPRICRLVPFWFSVLDEVGWSKHVIIPVRSPLQVAQSLFRRAGMSLDRACLLWLCHVLEAEAKSRDCPRVIIGFEAFLRDWRRALASAAAQMRSFWPNWSEAGPSRVDGFLSTRLQHHRSENDDLLLNPAIKDWTCATYAALLRLIEDPGCADARRTLDDVHAHFDKASLLGAL